MLTALVIPVPRAAPIVDGWREKTVADRPSIGIPPHVTLLFPFAPAEEVDNQLLLVLRELFAGFEPFGFTLPRTYEGEFDAVIPHLTVAAGEDELLDAIEADVAPKLPLTTRATEATLLEERRPFWQEWGAKASFPLGRGR